MDIDKAELQALLAQVQRLESLAAADAQRLSRLYEFAALVSEHVTITARQNQVLHEALLALARNAPPPAAGQESPPDQP